MMITGGLLGVSCSLKSRPALIGMPSRREAVRADQVPDRERPLRRRRQRPANHRVRRLAVVAAERRVVAQRNATFAPGISCRRWYRRE